MPRTPPVRLAGEEVSERHICALCRGSEELFAQVGSFIAEGLEGGDHGGVGCRDPAARWPGLTFQFDD